MKADLVTIYFTPGKGHTPWGYTESPEFTQKATLKRKHLGEFLLLQTKLKEHTDGYRANDTSESYHKGYNGYIATLKEKIQSIIEDLTYNSEMVTIYYHIGWGNKCYWSFEKDEIHEHEATLRREHVEKYIEYVNLYECFRFEINKPGVEFMCKEISKKIDKLLTI